MFGRAQTVQALATSLEAWWNALPADGYVPTLRPAGWEPPNALPDLIDDPDGDGDGFVDGCDNCPATANPAQTDSDADGIGDACEA